MLPSPPAPDPPLDHPWARREYNQRRFFTRAGPVYFVDRKTFEVRYGFLLTSGVTLIFSEIYFKMAIV